MKKVSIIVPAYNEEKYITYALDSIINQTYKDLEIILIDDGSTDNTLEIMKRYERKDNRIKVLAVNNKGVSNARNKGLDVCTGDYVMFVDADDYINQDYLEKMICFANKENTDTVKSSYTMFENEENKKYVNIFDEDSKIIYQNEVSKIFESSNVFNACHMQLINRKIINKLKIRFNTNLGYAEDFVFTYTLMKNSNKIGWLNCYGYNCRINPNSNSRTSKHEKQFKNINDNFIAYDILYNGTNNNVVANKSMVFAISLLKKLNIKSLKYAVFKENMKKLYENLYFNKAASKLKKVTENGNTYIFIKLLKGKNTYGIYIMLHIYRLLKGRK